MAMRCNTPRSMTAGISVKIGNPEFYALNSVTNEIIPCKDAQHVVKTAKAANKKANKPNLWLACQQNKNGFIMLDMSAHY